MNRTENDSAAPLVSVVIPTRGRPFLLDASIASAMHCGQTETIVVDDAEVVDPQVGSVASRYSGVKLIHGAGRGPSAARNSGAEEASTDWLVFLDDDDQLLESGVEMLLELVRSSDPALGLIFFGVQVSTDWGEHGADRPPSDLGPLFGGMSGQLAAGGFCVKRALFDEVGGYDEALRFAENTDLLLRIVVEVRRRHLEVVSVPTALTAIWRRPPDRRSSTDPKAVRSAAEAILAKHADLLRCAPGDAASFHRIAGVSAARVADFRGARSHFQRASSLSHSWTDRARLVVCSTPVLRSAAWKGRRG